MAFDITITVTYFAFLLGFGVLIANLLKKRKIPDSFFLLLLGLVLGPTVFMNPVVTQYVHLTLVDVSAMGTVPNFLRTLAIILIVFVGMFNLKLKVFKRFSDVSVNLAIVGVIFNTVFIGLVAHLMFGLNPVYALLMGAAISGTGTDVLSTFKDSLSKFKKSVTIMNVESIFNSPFAAIFVLLFLGMVTIEPGALFQPMKYASQLWLMIVAGVGAGVIIGLAVSKIMKTMLREYSSLILFSIALITYALAENVGGSGILAVAVCGLVSGNISFPENHREDINKFEGQLSEMLRISVFTLLGAQVMLLFDAGQFLMGFAFFLIVFLARPVFLIPTLGKRRKNLAKRDIIVMSFIAPKGDSETALAPLVAATIAGTGAIGAAATGNQIMNIMFIVILLSILFSTVVALLMSNKKIQTVADNWLKKREEKRKREIEEASVHKDDGEEYVPISEEHAEQDVSKKKPKPRKNIEPKQIESRPQKPKRKPGPKEKPKKPEETDKEEYSGS